ncbi:MAG: hypothetical protein M3125_09095 [Gemmatimonadota bacterium]|nr:hypothetical protein [Gemmatimonadota bacterium]
MRSYDYEESADSSSLNEPDDVFVQVAQTLVAQVRTMIGHRSLYQPVRASAFPQRDQRFYDTTESELAELGFEVVGDFEDASIVVTDASKRSFARFALGAYGAIAASWFEVPNPEGDPLHCLVLHTWIDDGRVLITTRGAIDSGLPIPREVLVERVDPGTSTKATVRSHGERVAATKRAPRRMSSAAQIFDGQTQEEMRMAEFRGAQGVALFEPMLRTMLSDQFEVQGKPILEAIRRHPEWMTGTATVLPAREADPERFPHTVIARIPEHIEPLDRSQRYEDPLNHALVGAELGMLTGGGTHLTPESEIGYVDLEIALANLNVALDVVKQTLESQGAPVGSQLLFRRNGIDEEIPFGVQEGVAVYLDGVSLPKEVYERTNIQEVVQRLAEAVESVGGEWRGSWSGPSETALYQFGPSADVMLDALSPVFDSFAICQNARVVIRQGSDGTTRTVRVPRRGA